MSVETQCGDRDGDPAASPLKYFGSEVKLERERLGWTRKELGNEAHCGYSLVAKIESGERVPGLDFARTCDRVFPHANGRFERLWPLALRLAFPPWFRRYAELEWKATVVRMFHPQLLPGLVQTPEYARAILRTARPTNLDDLVTARLERQRILAREQPARLWLIVTENVLRSMVGDEEVMRTQLRRLRDLADTPHHRVQIVKEDGRRMSYPNAFSPFGLLSFDEGNDVVHVDGFPKGFLLAEPDDVVTAEDAYDLLKAMACPPDESAELINSIAKDCYS
ncbi:helix-turn-helix domain-containing protein [Streptomyces sp. SID4919]|uniref:helix-turn-helix domain-containing protein n=1 Tax=unclassified Streptomyces TaxID=2593676 RepID=UPI000823AB3F|nr:MULTISPECIES: helix-turn-helix transcriptional regulator [unclassified Streptomyces]MYY13033.1 helix-turn-helix domain-containing protein [Streptomyces sp. SID4919]SCK23490.1 Predicted transcription factor, homolog of eukaryotic MBF1 [Streptomyces sp. AmelKG-E11A]